MTPATSILVAVATFVAGSALAAWLAWWLRNRAAERAGLRLAERLSATEATARGEEERRRQLEGDLEEARATVRELDRRLAVAEERGRLFAEARRELENTFQALAGKALQGNAEQFLTLASETLERTRTGAAGDLEARRQAIAALLEPLRQSLERLDRRTSELEQSRASAYSRIDEQVRQLAAATRALDQKTGALETALRGSRIKGRWGEIALRNVAELAGMSEHCDFEEQPSLLDGGRPDMTVRLPGGRHIAVDAKAPLNAYLKAVDAGTESERDAALDEHVRALRGHVRALAGRSYADALAGNVDLVVMFLPGDPFLAAAFGHDPQLQVEALRSKVLIATPSTLVALLRTVAIYWQQSAVVENAEAIAAAARELYDRAAKFGADLSNVGRGLKNALDAYNRAVGSFDRRLMPIGGRLETMKVAEGSKRRLETPEPIEETVRQSTATPFDLEN